MRNCLVFVISLCLSLTSCGQESRNVRFFKGTEAYKLAQAVEKENLNKIEKLVKENPELLNIINNTTGSNVLDLSLTLENFQAFKKLLELGANPNFINPYSKRSVLIEACKFYWKPESYTIDLRYIELLLQYGANPNYTVEEDFTDEKGHYHMATSSLMEASKLDLELVKLLIKAGVDPYKKLKQDEKTSFANSALSGNYDISNYFIDTLNVDVKQPMRVRKNDSLYIQDYIVNKFLKAKLTGNKEEMEKLKSENPKMEEANQAGWEFIEKLESMGVDFKNYEYKLK